MIIRRVTLRNIKSYKEAEIDLQEGITGIAGLNGSGKSTLLESIGYVLFDCLPYTQAEFVRKGEKTGEVTVEIVGADGCEYKVSRRCGSSQTYTLTDPTGATYSGKDDVGDRLCEVLGYRVPGLEQLRSLFENAIGVLQGTFVSEFLESPAKRKAIFDPLLRIDEYNTAFNNLRTLKALVKERIDRLENDKRYLEGRVSQNEALTAEKLAIGGEAGELQAKLERKRQELAGLRQKKEALDALEKVLQDLSSRQRVAAGEAASRRREVDGVLGQLQACDAAIGKLAECEAGFKAYAAKHGEKDLLDKKRLTRDALLTSLNQFTNALTEMKARLAAADKALQEIAEAEKSVPGLRQKVAEQERLEEEMQKVSSTLKALEMEGAQVGDRMKRAGSSRGNACPLLLNVECQSVKDFSAYFGEQTGRIGREKAALEARKSELEAAVKCLKNPRLTLGVFAEQLRKREPLQADSDLLKAGVATKSAEAQALLLKLNEYSQLEGQIRQVNEDIKRHQAAYETYQQNVNIASQKAELQQKLARATEAHEAGLKAQNALQAQLEEKKQAYDSEAHASARAGYEASGGEVTALVTRVEGIGKRLAAIEEELRKIGADLEKIEDIKARQAIEAGYMSFVDLSRNIIKQAGPEIVRVYIDLISREATRMYGEIAGDRRPEIRWTQDYDIVLSENGHERSFVQLSGGEQMSAALAVRLAILKILTNSDVVFLDEPTQNMDEHRRQNLALEITRIKDFRQMVVISHDDTFNANLENVVEIEKVNGESRVVEAGHARP